MKNVFSRKSAGKGVVKGRSNGLVISLIIHVVILFLAGLVGVIRITHPPETIFTPPKHTQRPPMDPRKPKFRMESETKPKTPERIISQEKIGDPDFPFSIVDSADDLFSCPDIDGLGLGMIEIEDLSPVGTKKDAVGSGLIGTFYDLKRRRGDGAFKGLSAEEFRSIIYEFFKKGWNLSVFSPYFRSKQKLYAMSLVVPPVQSGIVPVAFGDEDADGIFWVVHYRGQLVHKDGITFRFWASADETMGVRVNGKWVVGAKWANYSTGESDVEPDTITDFWNKSNPNNLRFIVGNSRAAVGDWITLEPGIPQDIEILIGDNGGSGCFMLLVEEKDVEYPRANNGGPLLPVFKTAEISRDMLDVIYRDLPEGECSLTTGPVFNDFNPSNHEQMLPKTDDAAMEEEITPVEPSLSDAGNPEIRSWNVGGESRVEAEFVGRFGTKIGLKNSEGKTAKIEYGTLSEEDRRFIDLADPPAFTCDFLRDCDNVVFNSKSSSNAKDLRPEELRCTYGARIKQQDKRDYPYQLSVEYFALGRERIGDKFILLDRDIFLFTPSRKNNFMTEYEGHRKITLEDYYVDNQPRGEKNAGFIITVTDVRGEIIAMNASHDWLFENLEKLRELRPGNFFDRSCNRVFPTRPDQNRY